MWLWKGVRRFGQVALPVSPKVKSLVTQLSSAPNRVIGLFPSANEHFSTLQELSSPLLTHLRHLSTDQLIATLRTYALSGEGSEELYQAALDQVDRRLRSFTGEQIAALCYYFARANVVDNRLNETAEREFLQNVSRFSPTAVAQLTYAFGNSGSDAFFRAAVGTFKANSTAFTAENGLLLLAGVVRKGVKDASLGPSLVSWTASLQSSQPVLVQIYSFLLKLHSPEIALKALETRFKINEMDLRTSEQLLDCIVGYSNRPGIEVLIGHIRELMGRTDVDVAAVARLIYTAKKVPEKLDIMGTVHKFLQRNLVLFTTLEVALIGSALLTVKDSNGPTMRLLADLLVSIKLPTSDLLRILLASSSPTCPLLPSLLPQIIDSLNGHILRPAEFVLLITILARINVPHEELWKAVLREAESIDLEDAEQYMQLYTALKSLQGVKVTSTLERLAIRYETGQSS